MPLPEPGRGAARRAPLRAITAAVLALNGFFAAPMGAMAFAPSAAINLAPTPTPCPRSLKFAGSLYLDTDARVPPAAVGPGVGETEPNPAQCALPDRLKVFRHNGHNATDEVVYYLDPGTAELFRSAGQTGFPGSTLVRLLVLLLALGIVLFAAVPAILGHLRQPPVGVGRDDIDWIDDVKAESMKVKPDADAALPDRDPPMSA